jgi:YidC/Oxa1 family membrane protein insertase
MAMMWLLDQLSWAALGNYGVAIIILVLLVRLVLHPLTKKSQISMMRMQKLAPQMQKLKEKYADDKNTLNKEMMKLYKEQGASPLLGCLPMLLQMPILVALFRGLNSIVELRHAAFLPVWITDLAAPDALFTFGKELPLIGSAFNLLPILLTVAMFVQQKFTPQSAQAAASPEQAQQQKMMKFMLPAMMLVFFYKAASGLNLYFMTSTFAGVLDGYFVRKHIREKEAAEAALQTTIKVPGKAARSARPKKPKGPFWVKGG